MKQFRILSFAIALIFTALVACDQAQENTIQLANEKLAKVEMKVDGMVCAMGCAKFIESKVAEQNGVKESKVDFEKGIAWFTFDQNQTKAADLEAFIDGIHDGQYQASILSEASLETEVKANEPAEAEESEDESKDSKKVSSVVNEIQNISFPELLTYFMKRL